MFPITIPSLPTSICLLFRRVRVPYRRVSAARSAGAGPRLSHRIDRSRCESELVTRLKCGVTRTVTGTTLDAAPDGPDHPAVSPESERRSDLGYPAAPGRDSSGPCGAPRASRPVPTAANERKSVACRVTQEHAIHPGERAACFS